MVFEIVATICAGLFTGAAIYVTAVEHPARLECGTALALREFGPSYRRGTIMRGTDLKGRLRLGCAVQAS